MQRLEGKRTLITGGTTGIGLETARQFLAEGARVAVTGTNPSNLDAARNTLGPEAVVISSDAGDLRALPALVSALRDTLGGLDALFINAGVADLRPLEGWDEAAFDRSFAINVKGPFFLIQSLLPLLANPSSIVLNGSVNAHLGMANTSVYGASKAALISLGRTLSGELLSRGIRFNTVSPGPIATPLYDKLGVTKDRALSDGLISLVPAKRFGQPSEIARAVVYLASDESAFTVGSELMIDGGMTNL